MVVVAAQEQQKWLFWMAQSSQHEWDRMIWKSHAMEKQTTLWKMHLNTFIVQYELRTHQCARMVLSSCGEWKTSYSKQRKWISGRQEKYVENSKRLDCTKFVFACLRCIWYAGERVYMLKSIKLSSIDAVSSYQFSSLKSVDGYLIFIEQVDDHREIQLNEATGEKKR